MTIQVTCGCGTVFKAPDQLAGQVVRCPACRQPVAVPETADDAITLQEEQDPDISDLTALDHSTAGDTGAQGSTLGHSGTLGAPKRRSRRKGETSHGSTTADHEISQEVDDRMTRLYEAYAGKEMRIKSGRGSKWKLLIGLGIAAMAIFAGAGIGWHVFQTQYGGTLNGGNHNQVDPNAQQNLTDLPRKQAPDSSVQWTVADEARTSSVELAGVKIDAKVEGPSRYEFDVYINPASHARDRRLSRATSVTLYRSLQTEGPFIQEDSAQAEEINTAAGSLSFALFDEVHDARNNNLLYYRLSGFDADGKRLFDTPVGSFAYLPKPVMTDGRVTWSMRSADGPAPTICLQARFDAPGWEDVLLWRVVAEGKIEHAPPDLPEDLPVVIEYGAYHLTGIELNSEGVGRWQKDWDLRTLERAGSADAVVVGAAPYAVDGGLDYRLTPDESHFTTYARLGDSLTLATPNTSSQTLTLQAPPALSDVNATGYDRRVHVGWENAPLIAGLSQYDGTIGIELGRIDAQGNKTPLASLSTDSTGFTDPQLPNGQPVSYELSLIESGTSSPALVHAGAWIEGHGKLPVLVPCPATRTTESVMPTMGLDRLYVSLGIAELCYPDTGLPARHVSEQLEALLSQIPGVTMVDRAGLRCFAGADTGKPLADPLTRVSGMPAQVQLRLVDEVGPTHVSLSLWVTDPASGRTHRLVSVPADQAADQAELFVSALRDHLNTRLPKNVHDAIALDQPPRLIVVGPIFPVEQPNLYYPARSLAGRLADAAGEVNRDRTILSRITWMENTFQDPKTIDPGIMQGTILIVGRAWSGPDIEPGLSLRAIDATSGRLIDRFTTERLTSEALEAFAQWCATLQLPAAAHVSAQRSKLLAGESALQPINPVWRQALAEATETPEVDTFLPANLTNNEDRVLLSFGLPLPEVLSSRQDTTERSPDDPLYVLRPFTAPQPPLTFEQWVKAYTDYVESDYASFMSAFTKISRIRQSGPVKPYLVVRGKHIFTGENTLLASMISSRISPTMLNLKMFLPMGAANQGLVDYRTELSEVYHAEPWAMAHAWKRVERAIALAFLKGELNGIEDGRYLRLTLPEKPVPFSTYVAADVLTQIGYREAYNFRNRALDLASTALAELVRVGDRRLSAEQMQWATDALLVLVYEQDPSAIDQLRNPTFREQYLSVEPDMQTDVLRMLVDQAGPTAWQWARQFDAIDWLTFRWRNPEELDAVTRRYETLFDESTLESLRARLP